MLNCRSIPSDLWVYARKCLVFYFSRRGNEANAEDLAQETLAVVWAREDFKFEKEEDFLKVCYGFARNILRETYRADRKHAVEELANTMESTENSIKGLEGSEVMVFLDEVRRRAQAELPAEELALIDEALLDRDRDRDRAAEGVQRTRLHRIRKKLAKLTGWQ